MGTPFEVTAEPYVIAAVAQAQPADAPAEELAQTQPADAPAEDVALVQPREAPAEGVTLAETTPVVGQRPANRRFHKLQITVLIVLALLAAIPLMVRRGRAERGSTTE